MDRPHSSYSCLEIHICWKVEREARMDPPIQTEYFLSGGAMILILMVEGARAVISFCIRSRSRSSLPPRGSTPSGSEDPSWPASPPSSRCGSPSRSPTSAAPPSSTASASKLLTSELFYILPVKFVKDCSQNLVDSVTIKEQTIKKK